MNKVKIDLDYVCTVIGNLTGIPIRVYEGDDLIFYHSIVKLPKDPICVYKRELFAIERHVSYFVTPSFCYYGLVKSGETRIIIGPTRQMTSDDQDIRELAFKADVPPESTDDFVEAIKTIVNMPLESMIQILFTVNHIVNGEKLSLRDFSIYDGEQERLRRILESEQIKNAVDTSDDFSNNTLAVEQTLTDFVRKGDTVALKNWASVAPAVRGGILAAEQLRQMKNTFIVTATVVCRAAIRGGMDARDALSLSDSYIKNCELLNSASSITNLQYRMVFDYTERVEHLRRGKTPSKLVLDIRNYIRRHLSDTIRTSDIADALFMNRSRLSTNFKSETGENLASFVLKEKTEEAKRLLRYSDKSLAAVSAYLGFSSQSHFTRIFKSFTGKNPSEYRETHGK